MATPAQIQATIDADYAVFGNSIATAQATYFAAHGRYWQGLVTHSVIPADGASVAANQLLLKPSYEAQGWFVLGVAVLNKPYALEIHQYHGPGYFGFMAILYVTIAGNLWVRMKDSGPEPYRTQGWTQQVAGP